MRASYRTTPSRDVMVGVGSALIDICLLESDSFLAAAGASKGGMTLVDGSRITEILKKSGNKPLFVPGGSACNTTLGMGKLGAKARFIGKKGRDEWGELFERGLRRHNVEPLLSSSPTPTGHVLSIITPDAQRSMLTFLGASAEMEPSEISDTLFREAALVHVEGYMLFNRELLTAVLEAAKKTGASVSLDLASYTVVEKSRDFLEKILTQYVDVLIANEDEARAFTGENDEEKACGMLARLADIAAVKIGSRGSLIGSRGKVIRIAAMSGSAPVVDTTGAGDLWASGFLFGLLQGCSIEKSGQLASACGYEVCTVIGATIPDDGWKRILQFL